jgi:cytoskeleton protein RodZ
MSSVGAYLRGLREQQGMSVDELSRATRVLHHYLEALESDDVRALPAPVFTKGFIRAYCQAVGISPDEALRLYDKMGVPAPELTKPPVKAVRAAAVPDMPRRPFIQEPDYLPVTPPGPPAQGEPREGRSRGTVLISFVLLVVLGAAFFAVTLALQSGREGDADPNAQATLPPVPAANEAPAAPPVPASAPAEIPAPQPPVATQLVKQSPGVASGTPMPNPRASESLPAPGGQAAAPRAPAAGGVPAVASVPSAPKPQAAPGSTAAPSAAAQPPAAAPAPAVSSAAPGARAPGMPYRLIARTTETTWMRVRTEDGRTSEETIPANEIREWVSNGPFVITIGNAGGVSLELNGRPVPRLGASGAVITRLVLPSDNQ